MALKIIISQGSLGTGSDMPHVGQEAPKLRLSRLQSILLNKPIWYIYLVNKKNDFVSDYSSLKSSNHAKNLSLMSLSGMEGMIEKWNLRCRRLECLYVQ